jgi:hypothetical protein
MHILCRIFGHKEKREPTCDMMGMPCGHAWHWVFICCPRCDIELRAQIEENTPDGVITHEFTNMGKLDDAKRFTY